MENAMIKPDRTAAGTGKRSGKRFGRRAALFALLVLISAGCTSDGHCTIFGYTTKPNYNCDIRTVYVPIFQNVTYGAAWSLI